MSIIVEPDLLYGAPFDGGAGQIPPIWFGSVGTDNRWYFGSFDMAGIDYIGGHLRVQRTDLGETNLQGELSGTFPMTPIVPGSVEFRVGNEIITDNGAGQLVGADLATGSIDYATGTWSFTGANSFSFAEGTCLAEGVAGTPALPSSLSFAWEIIEPPTQYSFIFYYTLDHGTPVTTDIGSEPASGTILVTIPAGTQSFSFGVYSAGWDGLNAPSIYDGSVAVGEVPTPPSETLVYGTVINIVEKDVLDCFFASWTRPASRTPGPNVDYYKSYAMDPNDPLAFWLWPRGYAGADVIVTYAAIPAVVTTTNDVLTLSDMYVPDLVDYLAYRALSKDSRGGARALAQQFRESFLLRLGAGRPILKETGQHVARAPDAEA